MSLRLSGIGVLLLLCLAAPFAFADEEDPPVGYSRIIVYWTGTCDVSKTYSGHAEIDVWCESAPFNYQQGTLAGRWRHTQDNACDWTDSDNTYEVCASGSSCSATSGTWQTITQTQFHAEYCP
jgi:hypothetical protein